MSSPLLTGVFALMGIRSIWVAPLTLPDESGGTPAYGTAIQVVGAQDASFAPQQVIVESPGDDVILDVFSKITALTADVKHGRFSFPSQHVIEGGTATATGTTAGSRQYTYDVLGTTLAQPFGFIAQGELQDLGDALVICYKCVCTTLPKFQLGYGKVNDNSFGFKAFPRGADGKLYRCLRRDTFTAVTNAVLTDT